MQIKLLKSTSSSKFTHELINDANIVYFHRFHGIKTNISKQWIKWKFTVIMNYIVLITNNINSTGRRNQPVFDYLKTSRPPRKFYKDNKWLFIFWNHAQEKL